MSQFVSYHTKYILQYIQHVLLIPNFDLNETCSFDVTFDIAGIVKGLINIKDRIKPDIAYVCGYEHNLLVIDFLLFVAQNFE